MSVLKRCLVVMLLLCCWQFAVIATNMPSYILPTPTAIGAALWLHHSELLYHGSMTLLEIGISLISATLLGLGLAILMLQLPKLERFLHPIMLFSQAVPTFALAPILILWFGFGILSKVMIATLMIFFPITVNAFDGLKRVPEDLVGQARLMGATPWQQLRFLRLPYALPAIGAGLKVAVIMAPMGVVIGEWSGAHAGLGFYMLYHNSRMDVAAMFAAMLVLAGLVFTGYLCLNQLLNRFTPWQSASC
ncbi:MAG: ABC transporter permease [Shewanellaceae bacterium]|nr:ABC transporter permease [Shewanellaceae bacterium]